MDFAILWLCGLSVGLLFVGLVTALSSRRRTTLGRRIWPVLAFLAGLLYLFPVVYAGVMLTRQNLQPKWLLWYGLSQTLAYVVGSVLILVRGLAGVHTDQQGARSWGRGRLALGLGLVLVVYLGTAAISDLNRRVALANVQTETLSRILGLLPVSTPEPLNAYPLYQQAMAATEVMDDPPSWLRDSLAAGAGFDLEKARQLLDSHGRIMELVREAVTRPILAWEVDLGDPLSSPLPKLQYFTQFAQLFDLSARCKILRNDPAGALADLKIIDAMAEQLRGYPSLLTVMVAAVVDIHYYQGLEYILACGACRAETVCPRSVICRPSPLESFLKALRLEGLVQLQVLAKYSGSNMLVLVDEKVSGWIAAPAALYWRIFFLPSELDSAYFITYQGLAKPASNYGEALANLEAIKQAREDGRLGLLTAMALPGYGTYLDRIKNYEARRGLTDLALAVTAFQAARHSYPNQLADLIPEFIDRLPVDPYGIGTFDLTMVDGGLVLSSARIADDGAGDRTGRPLDFVLGWKAYQDRFPKVKKP